MTFRDAVVLSHDGKMLVLGETVQAKSGQLEPTVHVFAVPSGKNIADFVHSRVNRKHRLLARLFGGIAFTPDGKFLITSAGATVKIWRVDGQS
jgi:WD40 repeat protein